MKSNVMKPNKKVFRILLAASAVLILCGAFCGAAAAEDLTATFSKNSIVETVTLHDVDTSDGQKYSMKLTASSLLWDEFNLPVLAESDLYIKPFKLEVTCNGEPYNAMLTIQFKVDKQKVEEYKAKRDGDVEVRIGHLKADRTWELLPVTPVTPVSQDEFLHYEVQEIQEPTSLFAIVVTKEPERIEIKDKTATPEGDAGKLTIINKDDSPASEVRFENVSGLNAGKTLNLYKLSGENILFIKSLESYLGDEDKYINPMVISPFCVEIKDGNESPVQTGGVMTMKVSLKKGYHPEYVKFYHFKNEQWTPLQSTYLGNSGYKVTTSSFSPFAVVYAEPKEKPAPKSSSSQGTSVWLTETPTPTPTPTATPAPTETPAPEVPTVKPVATETPAAKSPAPVLGVIAGLGAAAAVLAVRVRR